MRQGGESRPPDADADVFGLSENQLVMWLAEHFRPGTTPNHIAQAYRPLRAFDPARLRTAVARLSERHPQLRSRIADVAGTPVQWIAGSGAALVEVDGRTWTDDELDAWLRRETYRPFDLAVEPPARFVLVQRTGGEQRMVFVFHHIAVDLWSLALIGHDLVALYRHGAGEAPALRPIRTTYRDFVARQREALDGATGHVGQQWWEATLADPPARLSLPFERTTDAPSGRAGATTARLDAGTTTRLHEVAAATGSSTADVLMAALSALAHRLGAQDDLLLATNRANRSARNALVVGCFTNLVLVRSRTARDTTFAALVAQTAASVAAAAAHATLPYRRALALLRPAGGSVDDVAPQISFSWQKSSRAMGTAITAAMATNTAGSGELTAGFDVEVFGDSPRTGSFPLSIVATERDGEVLIELDHQPERFATADVARFVVQFERLLAAALAAPDTRVDDLPVMSPAELDRLHGEWGAHAVPFDESATVASLLGAQARRTPDAVAVSCSGRSITYAELDHRADVVAQAIVDHVDVPGSIVGLAMPRSLEMVVAVVGALKSGCPYVALDPDFPPERLAFMREDCAVRCVVDTDAHGRLVVAVDDGPRIEVEDDAPRPDVADRRSDVSFGPSSLAYLSYTSGSTGRPKAVQVEHRSVVNLLGSMARRLGLGERDVLLAVTTLSFDMSVSELLLPLVVGAHVVVADSPTASDPVALRDLLVDVRPTVMQATATMWRLLIEAGWRDTPGLTVICGAEPMTRRFADQLLERAGAVWNIYGPTEITVWASLGDVAAMDATITIGDPIDNDRLYVLDRNLQPVPVGVHGELCVGGAGVTRGYRNRPEANAAAFVDDPFAPAPGSCMYRTGDQARRLPDGRIELLGRIDGQVKIRGRRIELGEIESVLERQPGVTRAVVDVRLSSRGDQRLVAYVAGAPIGDRTAGLRAAVLAELPDYMVPNHFVAIDAIPLTPTKKVDRAALPWPVVHTGVVERDEQPLPGLERELAAVWSDLLDVPAVGRHDDFFDLGGHSMSVIELVGRLERRGHRIAMTAVVQAPTVAELAALIEGGRARDPRHWTSLVPIQTAGDLPPLFLVAPWGGTALAFTFLGRELQPDQPLYGLQPRGLDGDVPSLDSIEAMAAHYVAEMRDVQPNGPYAIGGHCSGGLLALEMSRQIQAAGEQVEALLLVDWRPPAVAGTPLGLPARVVQRARYYWERRRLVYALRHTLGRLTSIVRRVLIGSAEQRRLWRLRLHLARIHARYHERPVPGDAILIHTTETDELGGQEYFARWAGLVDGHLAHVVVPGSHATVLFPPLVEQLAATIAGTLREARDTSRSDPERRID